MVFNVLGLLVHAVDMKAPIVALECVGDLSAPSVLPNRRGSMSPCSMHEELHEPALDTVLEAYEDLSDEDGEVGTVKRTAPPARSRIRSPIRFDGSKDLFSPSLEHGTHSFLRRPSDISQGSPPPKQAERPNHHARRQSFKRPRIVTETFKTPAQTSSPQASLPASPAQRLQCMSSPGQEEKLRRKSREVFKVFFEDALRGSRSRSSSGASSVYSQSSGEMFTTPPTSLTPVVQARVGSPRPTPFDTAYTSSGITSAPVIGDPSSPTARRESSTRPPGSRKVSFARRSSPKSVEGDGDGVNGHRSGLRNARGAERSPFPVPLARGPKRDFSFEPGLHEQERRCEGRYGGVGKEEQEGRPASGGKARMDSRQGFGVSRGKVRDVNGSMDGPGSSLRQDNDRLRLEMAMLRDEFRMLREAVLVLAAGQASRSC